MHSWNILAVTDSCNVQGKGERMEREKSKTAKQTWEGGKTKTLFAKK